MARLAKKYGKTSAQIALRWLVNHDNVFAIPKAARLDHLKENATSGDFRLEQKDIDLINFEKELKNVVEELSSSYGDVKDFRNAPLKVPGDYNKLCFIDLSKSANGDVNEYSLIMNSWNDKINANIFLVKSDMEYSFYANNITITAENSLCFEIKNGKANDLRIEGVGGSAKISKT